jgi:cytochrome c
MPRLFVRAAPVALALTGAGLMALVLHPEPPQADGRPLFQGAQIDGPTLALFQRSCQNCHSERTEWPWYIRIPPASWIIAKDVHDARRRMNLSQWDRYTSDAQRDLLARMGVAVRSGRMPLPRYVFVHRKAILTAGEREQIYGWTRAERKRLRGAATRSAPSSVSLFPLSP